ncbi:periodic tryptophan protein 2 homolog isoform X2 [Contarinia nasturtii]|uniref:periodic tryptophan protein 2 homolog isoform X2 n=1 Tax=Contarinia nasturtii TaxID=265458 RepID=UPI0012D392D5|nr:periodic tryptophan protein 2 homolog isoform X2 [Contarinia nasturtii]
MLTKVYTFELVVAALPEIYVEQILEFVTKQVNVSQHVEFYLIWATKILTIHAGKENVFKQQSLISIQDSLTRKYEALSKVCDFNKYTLKVVLGMDDGSESENDSDTVDESDIDDNNLILIRPHMNGTHDHDIEMQMQLDSSDEMSTDEK